MNTNAFELPAIVSFENVPQLMAGILKKSKIHAELILDFSKVSSSNSALLALMIELIKMTKKNKNQFFFKNLPRSLVALAEVSDVFIILKPYII